MTYNITETDREGLRIAIIAAVAENGVIGDDGHIPWHYPEELIHFRDTTTAHPVIMGRKTFDSIMDLLGHPLNDRTSIVLSNEWRSLPEDAMQVGSIPAALAEARRGVFFWATDTVYVIGGASVYEQFLPVADVMILSELDRAYAGDTRFPEWDRGEWIERARDPRDGFEIATYEQIT
jgi:dihydrofolate reductase